MKSLILVLLILTSPLIIKGQEIAKEKKWTIGINTLSFGNNNEIAGLKIGNGVILKRKLNPFTLRLGVEYAFDSYFSDPNDPETRKPDALNFQGNSNQFLLKIGVEKSLYSYKFASAYAGIDLYGSRKYSNLDMNGGIAGISQNEKRTTNTFGALPLVGLEFKLAENFYLNSEFRFDISKSYISIDVTHYRPPIIFDDWEGNESNASFSSGFAIISLNYKF